MKTKSEQGENEGRSLSYKTTLFSKNTKFYFKQIFFPKNLMQVNTNYFTFA